MNGEDGSCSGDWISDDQFTALVNRDVAGGDEATGVTAPSDIPQADAEAGSSMWDSLSGAASRLSGQALDFLSGIGDWPAFGSLGGAVPLLAAGGTAYVGWKVGSWLAGLLGVAKTTGGPSGAQTPSRLFAVSAGQDLGVAACTGGAPGCEIVANQSTDPCPYSNDPCASVTAPAPSDGYIVQLATYVFADDATPAVNGASGTCSSATADMPAGAEPIEVSQYSGLVAVEPGYYSPLCGQQCPAGHGPCEVTIGEYVFFVPAKVVSLPGPGQSAVSPLATTISGWNSAPSEAQQKANAASILGSPTDDQLNKYQCAVYGPSGPCPFWATVPAYSGDETPSQYAAQLSAAGLQVQQTSLAETDTTVGDGDVVETNPAAGTIVAPNSDVAVAVNPASPRGSKSDQRCDVNGGAGSPGDPGPAPADGTSYPEYQLVQDSPYSADVDPTNSSPAQTTIPLRWGSTRWGWRHILQSHPYTAADREQTEEALATDPAPILNFASTNQYVFRYDYTMPDGGGAGGTITCIRSVPVEYWQDPTAAKLGVVGIRGIQNSYTGIETGGQ